jgi:hypothetical protein
LWTLDRECPKTLVSFAHLMLHHSSVISHLWIPLENTRIAYSISRPDYVISNRMVGIGKARPIARVIPRRENAKQEKVDEWERFGDNSLFVT